MARAFELAEQSKRTHPNPRVGAVVVGAGGTVVGEGNHAGPGHDHAEIVALKAAGRSAKDSTVYVSLEPCAHRGRTGPCTDSLIEAGVGLVVVGIEDPDPRVTGRGIKQLREAGIDVVVADDHRRARKVDPAYFHHRETGMPMVTIKWAMTLDGSVAAADATSKWITSDQARQVSHEMRAQSDAVVIGAGTLRVDDPLLTATAPGYEGWPQPMPVVIAGAAVFAEGSPIVEPESICGLHGEDFSPWRCADCREWCGWETRSNRDMPGIGRSGFASSPFGRWPNRCS